jgi:hypothetical protein
MLSSIDCVIFKEKDQSKAIEAPIFQTMFGAYSSPIYHEEQGAWGGLAEDNRQCINAVFWFVS